MGARRLERGSAAVSFVLVVVPVAVLLLATLQGIACVRLHGIVAAGAAEGARWAAAAGRSTRDGGPVAERVLAGSPAGGRVRCAAGEQAGAGGVVLVVVRCRGTVPALGPVHLRLRTTARAVVEAR
jgi:Flp pilus assembly protein TadG